MDAIVNSIIMGLICLFTVPGTWCVMKASPVLHSSIMAWVHMCLQTVPGSQCVMKASTSPTQFYDGVDPYVSSHCARFLVCACDKGIDTCTVAL